MIIAIVFLAATCCVAALCHAQQCGTTSCCPQPLGGQSVYEPASSRVSMLWSGPSNCACIVRVDCSDGYTNKASGCLMHHLGHRFVLTCAHAVRGMTGRLQIDGSTFTAQGDLVAKNEDQDWAILTFDRILELPAAMFRAPGDSTLLRRGERFWTVGFGSSDVPMLVEHIFSNRLGEHKFIVGSAACLNGDSGGYLFDERMRVIGSVIGGDGDVVACPIELPIACVNRIIEDQNAVKQTIDAPPEIPTPPIQPDVDDIVRQVVAQVNINQTSDIDYDRLSSMIIERIRADPVFRGLQGPPGRPGPSGLPGLNPPTLNYDEITREVQQRLPPVEMAIKRPDGRIIPIVKPLGQTIAIELIGKD